MQTLISALEACIRSQCPKNTSGILFTGGVDSTALTLLASAFAPKLFFAAIDHPSRNDYNRRSILLCQKISRILKLEFAIITITSDNYQKTLDFIIRKTGKFPDDPDLPAAAFFLKQISHHHVTTVFSGTGADELFRKPTEQLKKFIATEGLPNLREHHLAARRENMEFHAPFLGPAALRWAFSTPLAARKTKKPLHALIERYPAIARLIRTRPRAHSTIPGEFLNAFPSKTASAGSSAGH